MCNLFTLLDVLSDFKMNSYRWNHIGYTVLIITEITDLFHIKEDVNSLPIAYVDTSDAHVDLKYGALVLVSSLIEVSMAVLLD